MATSEKLYTRKEFERFLETAPEGLFELVAGRIVEKVPTQEHGHLAVKIGGRLQVFAEDHDLGRAFVEARYQVADDDENDRIPDVSYITDPNSPIAKEGAKIGMPDFVVEVQSPRDSIKDMREKADFYLAHGVSLVWLVYPRKKLVEVYRKDGSIEIAQAGDTLDASPVVPDFVLTVDYVFKGIE
jgi:Uma2 family endonuclease